MALERVCSKHIQWSQNTTQQTHAVFGESAHYGSEPFNLYGTNLTANLALSCLTAQLTLLSSCLTAQLTLLGTEAVEITAWLVWSKGQHFNYQASATS